MIAAINKDPEASIFAIGDFALEVNLLVAVAELCSRIAR